MHHPILGPSIRIGSASLHRRCLIHGSRGVRFVSHEAAGSASRNGTSTSAKLWPKLMGAFIVIAGVAIVVPQPELLINSRSKAAETVPEIQQAASGSDVTFKPPIAPYSMAQANAKLRQQMHSFNFDSQDEHRGRIDVARVPSNDPVEDNWSVGIANGPGGKKWAMAGVYDGHAGWATSTVLSEALIPFVSSAASKLDPLANHEAIDNAVKMAFRSLDKRIMDDAEKAVNSSKPAAPEALAALAPALSGSCALLSIYEPSSATLRTAVTGDSRAVLGSWSNKTQGFVAETLSVDQTGFNQDEVNRLDKAHPGEKGDIIDPRTGRLLGMAITRAFGDHRWKYPLDFLRYLETNFFAAGPRPKYKTPPYMTAEPEITTRQVNAQDFVILATDGLWDHISNEDAVRCVEQWLELKRGAKFTPELVREQKSLSTTAEVTIATEGHGSWRATPDHFSFEDADSAAVCLIRNAFGGTRRDLFRGVLAESSPRSRDVRDDITVQVIFFKDPYLDEKQNKKRSLLNGLFS